MVRKSKRSRGGESKYVQELKADIPGYLHDAVMKEVQRPEGLYNVQIVQEPKPPEGVHWTKSWIKNYKTRTIPIGEVRSPVGCATSDSAQYLLFSEYSSGVGFRTHGVYERVFVKQVEVIEGDVTVQDVEIIKDPTEEEMTPSAMRYRNMYTMEICGATHYESVVKAKTKDKVWYLDEKEVAEVKFMLKMEAYLLYMPVYNGWCADYNLQLCEVSLTEVFMSVNNI